MKKSIQQNYSRSILNRYVCYDNKFTENRKDMPILNKKYINKEFNIIPKPIVKMTYSFRDNPWTYFYSKNTLQLINPNYIYGSKYAISSLVRTYRKFIVYKPLGSIFIIPIRPNSKQNNTDIVWDINLNTIGQQIEDIVCNKIINSYAITAIHHKLKELNIFLTSETDSYDTNGYPIEITTSPRHNQISIDKLVSSYIGGCRNLIHFEHMKRYNTYVVRHKTSKQVNPINMLNSLNILYNNLKYIKQQDENIQLYITNCNLSLDKIPINTLSDIELKIFTNSKKSIDRIITNMTNL